MTRISSARVIPIYPSGPRRHDKPPTCWRVWVEWWGERQAMEMDCSRYADAPFWRDLILEIDADQDEAVSCGFRYGGVASHGGASAPPP